MTDFNINLNSARYAAGIDQGYNAKGEVYDIEVLSSAVLFDWDVHMERQGLDAYSGPATVLFKDWCNRNGVYYYGRPKEDFSEREALDLAAKACALRLLMEDMS